MVFNGEEIDFPAVARLSFFKVIEDLKIKSKGKNEAEATYAQTLLKEVSKYPELEDGFEDLSLLNKYKKPIEKLSKQLFPAPLLTNEIKGLTPPFHVTPFYTSSRFQNIIKNSKDDLKFSISDISADTYYLYCCYFILGSYYGYPVPGGGTMMVDIENKSQGLVRTYRMAVNADLTEFIPTENAVDISEDDYHILLDNFENMELWKTKFPPNSWIHRGINVINLMDVTVDHALTSIRSNLIIKSADSFENIQQGLRHLFQLSRLNIGMLTLDNGKIVPIHGKKITSILLRESKEMSCKDNFCPYTFDTIVNKHQPLVISDVPKFHKRAQSGMSKDLVDKGVGSFILAPIIYEDELLGYIELASENSYELNTVSLSLLNTILPVISMATKRFMQEEQNLIEAIIQQECTSIHPSVNWRFEEEARRFISNKENDDQPAFRDIIFKDVYPLYGQLDIKGSSETRNKAVKMDLIRQVKMVNRVLSQALELTEMPAYEELIYRMNEYRNKLDKGLSASSEHEILQFFKTKVDPVLRHIRNEHEDLGILVERYEKSLDAELKTVYRERKKYDDSVNLINQTLASFLDKQQEAAQRMFPHYFERYKTDGVEFNMYIGESISRERSFDPIYLQNLRIWQLLVICDMELRFNQLKPDHSMSLDIASLVLVHSSPLSVHFRMDEKQFDVEGAYNARYEIIKKRVDKAHIKGTKDRITQPGYLAIIYSQEQEAREYRQYIKFLQTKAYLGKEVEDVALEDLQGISGLRALRVPISYQERNTDKSALTVDEILQGISETS